jgi:hypothetical protein
MATVTVGCKLQNGIILQIRRDDQNKKIATAANGQPIFDENPIVQQITLAGANREFISGSGTGMTDVPEEFMNKWLKQHASWFPAFKNGSIFVLPKSDAESKISASNEKRDPTGLEGLNADFSTGDIKDARAQTTTVKADLESMRER